MPLEEMETHDDMWIEYDKGEKIQNKNKVRQVQALDQLVKQRRVDGESSVRKSNKPREYASMHTCKSCGSYIEDGENTCRFCACVCEDTFLKHPSLDDVKYKQEFMHYSNIPCMYKRINHFNEKLSQIQGKERTQLDDNLISQIKEEIAKLDINIDNIKPKDIKMILKKLNKSKYYEHCNYITHKINGYNLPCFTNEQEDKLRDMFNKIQKPFDSHSPPGRKNFLNYAYIFRKFLELLSYDEFLPYFSILKSRDKLYSQDQHWRLICKDLNWEFIPSL